MSALKFKDLNVQDFLIVIPSKGRAESCKGSVSLFPHESCLYVHESEVDNYRSHNADIPIISHNITNGYGGVINSVLNTIRREKAEIKYVMIVDDDMEIMESMVGNRTRLFDLGQRYECVVNAVQVMSDVGVLLYLFSTRSSIIKYGQNVPFKYGFSLPQGIYIIDTSLTVRIEEGYHYYEDFDFCMEFILKHRAYIIENRTICKGYGIDSLADGGCNHYRTAVEENRSRQWLTDKWKSHVSFSKNTGGNIRPSCNVKRTADQ